MNHWTGKENQHRLRQQHALVPNVQLSHLPNLEAVGIAVLSKLFINKPLLCELQAMAETLWLLKSMNNFRHAKWQQDPVLCDKPVLLVPCAGMCG